VKAELTAIIRRLDLNGDAKVDFSEIVEGLSPINLEKRMDPTIIAEE